MNWRDAIPPRPVLSIIAEVAEATQVTPGEILGDSRVQHIVFARHLAIWRARRETNLSAPQIGREFNRDHTSVLNAIRRIDAKMEGLTNGA